jgi:Skp family chaperone for outer membrane proteins
MRHFLPSAALAASLLIAGALPATVLAQAAPPATIIVVDVDRVVSQSAAGKQATSEIQAKVNALQSRANTLQGQLKTEADAIKAGQANKTLAGPAFDTRVQAFGQKEQSARQELGRLEGEIQRSRQFVLQQISDGVGPIVSQLMKERGANIALPKAATLQFSSGLDVTAEVISRLDKALPKVSTTPPAQAK